MVEDRFHFERSQNYRYAARLNAFKQSAGGKVVDWIAAARKVSGINAADLNYPDHFEEASPALLSELLAENGMALSGLAMRYYSRPEFTLGAFTNPDCSVRQDAIDLTRRGIDILAEMGGGIMTLWMGQDGFDYPFQVDYDRMWDDSVAAMAEVADHNPDIAIAIEYKPNEPRAFALMPDAATTLLAISEIGRSNLGVTVDFAHSLMAGEMPAHAVRLIARHSRLLGVHLNDGYGLRDDGLMVGTNSPARTVELLIELQRCNYDGMIYFDTFPDMSGLDPVEETRTNIAQVNRLRQKAERLFADDNLAAAISRQDAARSQRLVNAVLLGE